MTNPLITIVILVFSIIALFILWWIAYPFLLRYAIESVAPTLRITQSQNGNNGKNGLNGRNSPDTKHGVHGQPGLTSPAGRHGNNGRSGKQGELGVKGHEGEAGDDGLKGEDGVPGHNIITVKSNSSKIIYYVNGVPLETHVDNAANKAMVNLQKEKDRVLARIETSFSTVADKNRFKNALTIVTGLDTPSDPNINILDNITKFNNFLDGLKNVYEAARIVNQNAKTTNLLNIENANKMVEILRKRRDLDYSKIDTTAFKLAERVEVRDSFIVLHPVIPTPLSNAFTALTTDINVTFDSKIRDINLLIVPPTQIINSIDPAVTVAQKNTAVELIHDLTFAVNSLKSLKEQIALRQNNHKSLILDWYTYGNNHSPNVYSLPLEDYGVGGANAQKTIITNARTNISNAQTTFDSAVDTYISPYRSAN